jgi:hypothetical protein
MNANTGSFHPSVQVGTQPAPRTGGQVAQPPDGIATRFAITESLLTALLQKVASSPIARRTRSEVVWPSWNLRWRSPPEPCLMSRSTG